MKDKQYVRSQIDEKLQEIRHFIEKYPVQTVVAGAVIGLIAGMIFIKRRK